MDHEDSGFFESYHSRVGAFKRRIETALPYGEPLLFAAIAFAMATCLLLFLLNIIDFIVPATTLPLWVEVAPYVVGAFTGYTSWKYATL